MRTRIRGRTSTHPAIAHSIRIISLSLLTARGCATVLVRGKVFGKLLKPYAMAASSMISHSWRISGRVAGTSTSSSSGFSVVCAESDMRLRSFTTSDPLKERPVHSFTKDGRALNCCVDTSGVTRVVPSGKTICTGSILKKHGQSSANVTLYGDG